MVKFQRWYACTATLLLLLTAQVSLLNAQAFTAKLEHHSSLTLDKKFSQYEVFQLDATPLDNFVKANPGQAVSLKIGAHQWQLQLQPNRVVSYNYTRQVHSEHGTQVVKAFPDIAYKGYETNAGGKLRLTLHGEFLYGFVEETGDRYYIEPLWYFEPSAAHDLFVLYPRSAVKPTSGEACGVTEEFNILQHLGEEPVKEEHGNAENMACYQLELAIASDRSMFDKYGSVGAVEDHNVGVINNVTTDYTGHFNHDIEFNIVTQFVVTGNDPWSNSTDAGTFLASFRTWGEAGNFGVGYDVGEIWTNRNFNGGTVGIAYVGVVCTSFKYHALQDFTGDAELLRCMTSHELGHNFSAGHDNCPPGNWIMCPFVSDANSWSDPSTNAINNHIQSRINNGCLGDCAPPPPLEAAFDWSPNPGCQGEPVTFTDQSGGIINSWSWTFQGGSPPSSNQQNPTVTWNSPGQKNVTLTINGVGGSNSITQVVEIIAKPVANFTYAVDGLVVTFTNTSTSATNFEWDFGDGFISNEESPIHEYGDAGNYTVVLTVSNQCGTSTKSVNVNTAPIANFSAEPTSGCAALVVVMDNQSSSNAVTYAWSFPGGTPAASNQPNPTVVYNIAGTYSISLTAFNSAGSHTFTRTDYITVKAAPVANYNVSVNNLTASFTNTSLNNPTSYSWNFGDNTTSSQVNPVHTYAAAGTYTVVLTATNDCGTSTKSQSVTVTSNAPPTAAFTANPTNGCAPLTVNFTNNSTGATSYLWTFPGGTPDSSTVANPSVVYSAPGTYIATLTATNVNGNSSISDTITVITIPVSDFGFSVANDTSVTFANGALGADSYLWTFGDGDSSTVANPVHDYPALDSIVSYMVLLHAVNACGTVIDTQWVTIVTNPHAGFTATPTSGCAPLTVQFNNTSTPNATSFHWLFPGGVPDTSVVKNPVVVYNTPGVYTVTLIAINSSGRDTMVRNAYIVVNTVPSAAFGSTTNGLTVAFTNNSLGASTYAWDFGDNTNSTETNPTHTYAADGTYTVTLSATNACGTTTSTQTVTVSTVPTAGFTLSANTGCAPFEVVITNTSSPNATTFDWQFPGGNPSSSSQQNPPAVAYNLPGTYTITLTVSNASGSSTFSQNIVLDAAPNADFSSSVSGLEATFTNSSSNALTYSWDFGDGETSTDANPQHSYGADGTYTVILTATNDCGTSTFTQQVVINTEPSAGFSANTTSGCAVLTVNFTDISAGDPVAWEWTFPGGAPGSSNEQNPTVNYFSEGIYDVTLVVTSAGGSTSSFTQTNLIQVNGAPSVGFNATPNGSVVTFANNSSGATSYLWNFGDGTNSTEENPVHTYTEDGVYTVSLSATNNCGTAIYEQSITVATPPSASFTYDVSSGCEPLTVNFSNTSSTNATSFEWDFPGGEPASSTETNPSVVWNTAGVYVVTLTASNAAGSSTSTATITVGAGPNAGFSYQIGGLSVIFDNTSVNGSTYLWNFGDGSDASMEENPTHTYAQTGTYTVSLTVSNECGTLTITQEVLIEGEPPVPAISANQNTGCQPLQVLFSDQSAGDPTSWNWTFAGGTPASSTEQNPTVTYLNPGTYDVILEVTNIYGAASQTFPAYVNVLAAPSASYTVVSSQTTVVFTNSSQGATSYLWNFGDGNTSTEENPTHTYASAGSYTVTLSATNSCGTAIYEQVITLSSGVGEAAWVNNFRLFPNPNTGVFSLELAGQPQAEVEFVLFNAIGQMVKRETADFGTGKLLHTFRYNDLATGVYALRVQAQGEAMYVKVTIGE